MTLCGIALTDSDIIVGNGSGLGADVAMSGDVTIDDTGKTTIQRTAGISSRPSCRVATTAALTATYSNGSSGVGATLTNSGTQAAISIDGKALSANDRVLVKDQATAAQNGIYTVTTVGSGSTNWVLTRATDFNTASSAGVVEGAFTVIEEGTSNLVSLWVETGTGPFTIGTTAITFSPLKGTSGVITVSQQVFTGAGTHTYTPTAGMVYAIAEVIGGGGGGGGGNGAGGGGGGGGGGGYSRSRLTAAQVGASQTVTIGAAGAAGISNGGNAGGNGGQSSIGTLVIGKGGTGGAGGTGNPIGDGGSGGVSGTGDLKFVGNDGNTGYGAGGGSGGASAFGGAGRGGLASSTGGNAGNYGGGGGGGGGSGGDNNGGAGTAGITMITEYCT